MKKLFLLAATAALILTSCAKIESVQKETVNNTPVSFGVYAGRSADTKAVSATDFGDITTSALQGSTNGFGVFAYYTDNASYTPATHKANFMYNEQVTYSTDHWAYAPIKYWPNEHGSSASSDTRVDKLTFLAYAPYAEIHTIGTTSTSSVKDGSAAVATEGIIAMTGNNTAESATLTFKVPSSSAEQIDLLYGVLNTQSVNVDGTNEGAVDGPIVNLTKQKTNGKVDIKFKHALAKATIDICDVIDAVSPTTSVAPTTTKVVVTSLNILGVAGEGNGFGTQGTLNLYTGNWVISNETTSFAVSPLPATIYVDAAPTSWAGISSKEGVLEGGLTSASYTSAPGKINIMFIPGGKIKGIDITYYVVTEDTKLNGGVSVVENHITKDFASPITTAKSKIYNINIQLGLTSVQLNATVAGWDTPSDNNIDLPANVSGS